MKSVYCNVRNKLGFHQQSSHGKSNYETTRDEKKKKFLKAFFKKYLSSARISSVYYQHTMAHSRARTLIRLLLFSSAYSAPIREPMEVPPTMSIGIPASFSARRMPTWEQPLKRDSPPSNNIACHF